MKRLPSRILLVILLSVLALALAQPAAAAPSYITSSTAGEPPAAAAAPDGTAAYYIQYAPGANRGALVAAVTAAGGRVHHAFDRVPALAISLPPAAAAGLSRRPDVRLVERVPQHRPLAQATPWNVTMVQAPDLWDANRDGIIDPGAADGTGVKVCIIDTGLFAAHDDFQGMAVSGLSQITGETWDQDGFGHGTHVAGTINAVNNDIGVVGVLPGRAELFIVKIFNNSGKWVEGQSNLAAAATACKDAGARVINMSLGDTNYSATEEAVFRDLYDNFGILSVAAAGNSGGTARFYPASYDSVIAVAALREDGGVANYSQFPPTSYDPANPPANAGWDAVELAAGGDLVLSTVPSPNGSVPIYRVTAGGSTFSGLIIGGAALTSPTGITALLADGGLCGTDDGGAWAGKIVLCQRGTYTFATKINNVQTGGGVGAVIYNNAPGNFTGACGGTCTTPNIPAISLSQADGQALLGSVGQTVTLIADDGSNCPTCIGGYGVRSGTSMAAPAIAAGAALLWDACGGTGGSLTNQQVRRLLRDAARDLGDVGWDARSGWGVAQLKDALALGGERFGWQVCPPPGPFVVDPTPRSLNACVPGDATFNLQVGGKGFLGSVNLGVTGLPAGATAAFSPNPVAITPAGAWLPASLTVTTAAAADGFYPLTITAADTAAPATAFSVGVSLGLKNPAAAATLAAPTAGGTGLPTTPTFTWNAIAGALSYEIQVATDPAFTNVVAAAAGLTGPSFTPSAALAEDTVYYWRARADNGCGGRFSAVQAFRTEGATAADYSDLPASYGVAWHTGGAVRLGSLWDEDASFAAAADDASDDGVTRGAWSETTGVVNVTVTGATGYVSGWFDWNGDGDFADAGELAFANQRVNAGHTVLKSFPAGASVYGKTIAARFRVYPARQTALAAAVPDAAPEPAGAAANGEVEDYTWSFSPLAVTLASFTAAASPNGVTLAWETVSETDNAGFNVYRAEGAHPEPVEGAWVRLNPAPIPAAAPGSSEGHSYTWTDATAVPGVSYWYMLEDIALDGTATQHPPVQVTVGEPNAVGLAGPLVVTASAVEPAWAGLAALTLIALAAAGARRRRI